MQAQKAIRSSDGDFVHQLPSYAEWFHAAVILQDIYRTTDASYCQFLQEVSNNKISEASWEKLRSRVGLPLPSDLKVYAWTNRECKEIQLTLTLTLT